MLRTIPDGISVFGTDCDMVIQNDQLFEVLDLEKKEILCAASPGHGLSPCPRDAR